MHPRCRHIGAYWDLIEWFHLFGTSQNSILNLKKKTSQNSISNLKKNQNSILIFLNQIYMFPCCSTLEDLSIDVSITNVGLILTKLRWFQLFVKSQNSNFKLFWQEKFKFVGFHAVVLVKTFPLMYQLLM